ncbi:MAG TPA: DUF2281 domain-containing protein [Pyrinomonadaceae bacterium]|nr:DUF2281 domain-containing protein [Pyrinomonadaceae bacterium]
MQNTSLIEKIQNLPPETRNEVEDFVDFLVEKRKVFEKKKRDAEQLAFAETYAGTEFDLDEDLEAAGVEHLLETIPEEE